MAEQSGEVVEVVVETLVPVRIGGGDLRDGVEVVEDAGGGGEVGRPVWIVAAHAINAGQGGGVRAGVAGFEGIDARGLYV